MPSAPSASHFDAANQLFHETYTASRDQAHHEAPILVLLQSELVLHFRALRKSFTYQRPSFDQAKVAAHIAVALYVLSLERSQPPEYELRLDTLLGHARAALGREENDDSAQASGIAALLSACSSFGQALLESRTTCDRERFARAAGEHILRLTELATREQLAGLHEAVNAALTELDRAEHHRLEVVVAGDHQARARSAGMQYFERRLGEAPGADGRVTYGENISTEAEALALIGTRRLDRKLASAFFGDETRLQRDVLGDAAKACLDELQLKPDLA